MAKMRKATVMKGHKIAKAVAKRHKGKPTASDYKIGMSQAKKSARKRKKK
jgi:hypothetical protein